MTGEPEQHTLLIPVIVTPVIQIYRFSPICTERSNSKLKNCTPGFKIDVVLTPQVAKFVSPPPSLQTLKYPSCFKDSLNVLARRLRDFLLIKMSLEWYTKN